MSTGDERFAMDGKSLWKFRAMEIFRQRRIAHLLLMQPTAGCAPWMIAGRHRIRSFQGTLQGDPLGIYLLSPVMQLMIGEP